MSEEQLRKELYAANENRARAYWHIYDEMRREFGREKAMEVMKRAIYRRGCEIGEKFARFAPDDFEGLKDAFVGGVPDQGRMFKPTVRSCGPEGLEIEFADCPLKNAWRKMGLTDEECAEICDVANTVDTGTFEGAGFDFACRALPQGEKDRCILTVTPRAEGPEKG